MREFRRLSMRRAVHMNTLGRVACARLHSAGATFVKPNCVQQDG